MLAGFEKPLFNSSVPGKINVKARSIKIKCSIIIKYLLTKY